MRLYEVATRRWRSVARGNGLSLPVWSADSAYFYYQDLMAPAEPLFRMKISSAREERIADFQKLLDGGVGRCVFVAVTGQGQPVVSFDKSADIHGATLSLP